MKFFGEQLYLEIYKKNNYTIRKNIDKELDIYKLSLDPGYVIFMTLNTENNTNNNFNIKIIKSPHLNIDTSIYTIIYSLKTNYTSKLYILLYLLFNYANVSRYNDNEWFNFNQVLEYNKLINNINDYITFRINKYKDKFDLNTCSLEDLCTIPFINKVRAQAILNYRKEYGFTHLYQLEGITGIGKCIYDQILNYVYIQDRLLRN